MELEDAIAIDKILNHVLVNGPFIIGSELPAELSDLDDDYLQRSLGQT